MTIDQKIEQLRSEMDIAEKALFNNISNLNPIQMLASANSSKSTLPKLGLAGSDSDITLASFLPLSLLNKYGHYFKLAQRMYRLFK